VDDRSSDPAASAGPDGDRDAGVSVEVARGNTLLAGLPDADLSRLMDEATETSLSLGTVLYEPGRPVETVHFPLSGVISIVTDLGGGAAVEAATVGLEGMSGISVFLGAGAPTERAVVQVAGRTVALDVAAFERAAAPVDRPLYGMMRRYTQVLFTQLARNVACSRAHTVEQRAARWLLTTSDRMRSPTFVLTQELLAQVLAVRRASISGVASGLAEAGCIRYVRGTITVLDRQALLARACDCYRVLRGTTEHAVDVHRSTVAAAS
jgi:CRP-like cAMP-binding protein